MCRDHTLYVFHPQITASTSDSRVGIITISIRSAVMHSPSTLEQSSPTPPTITRMSTIEATTASADSTK